MKKIWMRAWMTALTLMLLGAVLGACPSPVVNPIPEEKPQEKEKGDPPPEPLLYDVTYFGNGSTAGERPVDMNKYEYGKDQVTVLERGRLCRVGYRFTGWNTRADGTGQPYAPGEQFTMGDNPMPIYAQWAEIFPKISAGEHFSTLITPEGVLYATGRNTAQGRLGDGTTFDRQIFTPVATTNIPGPVQMVSSGTDHNFAVLRNGSIVGWGQGNMGKLALDLDDTFSLIPKSPFFSGSQGNTILGEVSYVSLGRNQTAVLTKNGQYWAAGTKTAGAMGNGEPVGASTRERVLKYVTGDVVSLAAGNNFIMLIKSDGALWIAGEGGNGKLGTANTANVPKLRKNTAIDQNNLQVFAGKNNHSMILKKDGRILAAGQNNAGQLGNGTTASQNFFAEVLTTDDAEMQDVAYASLGDTHSMILKNDGTLWAVGRNNELQLGITTSSTSQLKAVKVMEHVAHVAAGYNHTLVVKEDGTLWAAGSNQYGQFGRAPSPANETSVWTMIDISQIIPPVQAEKPAEKPAETATGTAPSTSTSPKTAR